MRRRACLLLAFLLVLVVIHPAVAENATCVYFFYGDGCQHCAKVEPYVGSAVAQSSFPIELHSFEVYANRSNMLLLQGYFDAYAVPDAGRGIPAVLVGKEMLVGDSSITGGLDDLIARNHGAACPTLTAAESAQEGKIRPLSLLTVIGAALVDSINPCAIAVLLILMGALLAAGGKGRAIRAGLAFTISIYISYFLFGLGLFSAIQVSGISYWFYRAIGILAIVIGLANIKDFFSYGAMGFVVEIPRRWRPRLKRMLSGVTSPIGAFLIGFVVCLFELPCTGGPYIVILGLLADRMTMWASIPLLLLYNVVFVLPLLAISLLIYFGFANVERATAWKEKNLRVLHLIAGLIMLVLGVMIAFGLV